MNLQALVDGMSAHWQRERAASQMTLGGLIEALEAMPAGAEIDALGDLQSYRGYYCDLAFEPATGRMPASAALAMCRAAMGQVFTGYKGGDYVMGALTPLWIAEYGTTCGALKLIALDAAGHFATAADDD